MKRIVPGLLVLALAGLVAWNATSSSGVVSGAGAPQPGVETTTPSATPSALSWFTDWPRAVAAARRRNQLVFVYLGLDPKVCPPCARMERDVFGRADAGRLADRCVLVKAEPVAPSLGGPAADDTDVRSAAFLDGLRVGAAPTIILFNAEGHMLHRQVSRLAATHDRNGRVDETRARSLFGLDDLIVLVDATAQRERREALEIRRLAASGTAEAHVALASRYSERERHGLALTHLRQAAALQDDAVTRVLIAETLEVAGAIDEAVEAYAALVATFPDHPRLNGWRLALTLLRLSRYDPATPEGLMAEGAAMIELQEIATIAAREQQFSVEDEVQLALGRVYQRRDQVSELEAILDWFEQRADDPTRASDVVAPDVRWNLAEIASEVGRGDLALKHMERLVRDHPESVEAQRLEHGVLDAMRNQ